jgi:predicted nucleic acid-binding protein
VALVFLDANVLFSAAYRPDAGLVRLWHVAGVELISSDYAVQEARRNLATAAQRERLETLTADLRLARRETAPRVIIAGPSASSTLTRFPWPSVPGP